MPDRFKSYWITVGFAAHCTRALSRIVARYDFEPAWHRLAISQAAACARLRALLGGSADDGPAGYEGVLIVDDQYFDHHDTAALMGALRHLSSATANTVAEVDDQLEVKIMHSATVMAALALGSSMSPEPQEEMMAEVMELMAFSGLEEGAKRSSRELLRAERHMSISDQDPMPVALDLILQRSL